MNVRLSRGKTETGLLTSEQVHLAPTTASDAAVKVFHSSPQASLAVLPEQTCQLTSSGAGLVPLIWQHIPRALLFITPGCPATCALRSCSEVLPDNSFAHASFHCCPSSVSTRDDVPILSLAQRASAMQ